jgi:PAS domain S-box-containing protein
MERMQPQTDPKSLAKRLLTRLRQLVTAPSFEGDEDKTRIARLLHGVLLVLLVTTVFGTIAVIAVEPPSEWFFSIVFGVVMTALVLGLRAFLHRGHVQAIGAILSLALWAGITALLAFSGGLGNTAIVAYFLLIGVTNLLLGERLGVSLTVLILLAVGGLYAAEATGLIPPMVREATRPTDLTMLVIALILTTLVARYVVRSTTLGLDRARRSERALAERNRDLEASQRVTFAASERVTPDELLGLVVDLIRDQFHLYHVQAYIVDEEQKAAVLRESTGYAGHQLLQKGHCIPLDRPALVTKAIREGRPVLVTDVSRSPDFMPNPLLPETRSEMVVPMKIGGHVIGVLDAQDRTPGRFNEQTAGLFQTMADQIAFLFENSELLESVSRQTETLTAFTGQLRTAADIAARLSTIRDPEQLLQEAVELMQGRFGLYHAQVYVLDDPGVRLSVHAGSGDIGRILKDRKHSISAGEEKNIVAHAARAQEVVVINDTSLESDFTPTPLLPQTRSEMAVPLVIGKKTLGVLDLQANQAGRFKQADVDAFTILSGQISTAMENARLFEERQHTESALRQSEDRYRDLFENALDIIYTHDLSGRFTSINKAAERITGYRRDEILEMSIADIMPPDQAQKARQMVQHKISGGGDTRYELQIVTRDGRRLPIEVNTRLTYHGGKPFEVQGIARDITQYKQAEEEHRRFTNQLRTAADLAERINAILDPDRLLPEIAAQLQSRLDLYHVSIYLLNDAGTELVLEAGSGDVGKTLREQAHAILLSDIRSVVVRSALARAPVLINDVRLEPGFASDPLLSEARSEVTIPLVAGDRLLGVLDVHHRDPLHFRQSDINSLSTLAGQIATALRNATLFAEIQTASQQLREANRIRDELLAKTNHQVRTPLNSIIGYAEIMLMELEGELNPPYPEYVQAIYDNGQQLLFVINDLLDIAGIEAGNVELDLEEVQLETLVNEISSDAPNLRVTRPVALITEIDQQLPTIKADPVRLKQILNNIVANIANYTTGESIKLHIFADRNERSTDDWICMTFRETQSDSGSRSPSGDFVTWSAEWANLGLILTQHLVEMHGGEIDTHGQPDQDDVLTIRLPIEHHVSGTPGTAH